MQLIIHYNKPEFKDNKIINFNLIKKYIIKLQELEVIKGGDIIQHNQNNNINGGDIFDELNLDDIIIKKKLDIVTKEKKTTTAKTSIQDNSRIDEKLIYKLKIKKSNEIIKGEKIEVYTINNLSLNSYNSLYDIKLLIYYLLNISIEDQYLYSNDSPNLFYSYVNKINETNIDLDISKIVKDENKKYYNNIPIDFDLINNRINYVIKTNEKNSYLLNLIGNKNLNLNFYNLNDFIIDNVNLNLKIQQDDELLSIIYNGFVEKYFPYYDKNLFLLYLSDENKYIEYPNLQIQNTNIINKIDSLYNIYSNNYTKKIPKDKLNTHYKKLIYKISSYNNLKNINVQNLFNNIELKTIPNLKKIELQVFTNDKFIFFSKINLIKLINKLDTYTELEKLFINDKNYNILLNTNYPIVQQNYIFLIYNQKENTNKNNKKAQYNISQTTSDIYIIIDEYFNIYIIYNNLEYSSIELKTIETLIINEINELLNNFYKQKLITYKKSISNTNLELLSFDYQILFEENMGINKFKTLIDIIQKNEINEYYKIQNIDIINNIIELDIIFLDILHKELNDVKLIDLTNNYYNFYSNSIYSEKYHRIIYTGKIIISNRFKDIKLDILNINNIEYKVIYQLISYILYIINPQNKKPESSIESKSINKLKKLKEIDPILYNINKKNTQNLYSRKCQSNQQPDILTEKDIKSTKIKNYIKYWNFTSGEPIYYHCNNKKFPTVKFLTNLHPQNYCIPCCKKKAIEDVKIKSKYIDVHNECLKNYIYDKKKTITDDKSRYIMNYSSKIILENTRLMQIPNVLDKLFIKYTNFNIDNENDKDINNELDYYILGLHQDIHNLANVGILYIISIILDKSINDIIDIIKTLFIKDSKFISNIYDGKLLNYFKSTVDFIKVFTNIFQNKILLDSLDYEFNNWNELLIDIAKYLGYIFIIFEENDNNTTETNLDLIIPQNIKHVNEYIYNNDIYNYVIVIKRNYKNKILYYPVIKANPSLYNKNNTIVNKIYNYNSTAITLISQIISKKLNINVNTSLNLELIEKYILEANKFKISKYFINKKNEIYSLLLEKVSKVKNTNKEYIYIVISKQKILNYSYNFSLSNNVQSNHITNLYNYNYIDIEKYNIKINTILEFISSYNLYIYTKNKSVYSEHIYKLYISDISKNINNLSNISINEFVTQNTQNDTIDKELLNYIQINKLLLFNNNIIGVKIDNYHMYISKFIDVNQSLNIINNKKKELIKILNKNKINKEDLQHLIIREFKHYNFETVNLLYNPHSINKIIYKREIVPDTRIKKLNESIYNTNLYNLILLHFSNELINIKNTLIRNKIKLMINNLTFKDFDSILNNTNSLIKDLITKNIKSKDTELILKIYINLDKFSKDNIYKYYKLENLSLNQIKRNIISNLDATNFLFDKMYIYNILGLPEKELKLELNKIFKNIIIETNVNESLKYDNIINLRLCNSIQESYYCKNNKLIISKKQYNNILDILYYDLTNPFKQTLILNLLNYNLNNIYKFKQFINEKIYIYL